MRNSRRNRAEFPLWAGGIILLLTAGCATSSYKVANRIHDAIELEVSPDRVALECEYASERKEVPYGFMIHVLDDQDTVTSVSQMNTLSKADCDERVTRIGKILKRGTRITIAGIGEIDQPRVVEKWRTVFPRFGTFNSNGRSLQFIAISNERGECYDAYSGETPPCPQSGIFPLEKGRQK